MVRRQARDLNLDLRSVTVTAQTRARYSVAFAYFLAFAALVGVVIDAHTPEATLDDTCFNFVQWCYSSDLPKYYGNLVFASVLDQFPRARLEVVRRALKGWERIEPACQAFPINAFYFCFILCELLLGDNFGKQSAGFTLKLQLATYALLVYHGVFRPSEIISLTRREISLQAGCILVRVRGKTEIRFNLPAVCVRINDPFLFMLLQNLIEIQGAGPLFFSSTQTFSRFCKIVSNYWPHLPRITPYSFKRGGASHLFRVSQSYDVVTEQGR